MSRISLALGVVFTFSFVLLAGAIETNAPSSVAATSEWREISFRNDVNPIFQQNCSVCHAPGGAGYAKSGFSVQNYQTVMKGTRFGAAVIPGSSVSSSLVLLLKHGADPSISMPKMYHISSASRGSASRDKNVVVEQQSQRLSPHDVWLISTWIDQGAKDN
jgi:hypothetical protein